MATDRRGWLITSVAVAVALVAVSVAALTLRSPATTPAHPNPPAALGIWEAALDGVHGVSPDATVREIARVSVAGFGIRVRLSNPYGSAPVVVKDAWLGYTVAPGSASLVRGSNHRLTFAGSPTVSIAPGASVFSDSLSIGVTAQQDLAISVYAPGSPVDSDDFPSFAYDPPASYIGTGGDTAAAESPAGFRNYPTFPGNSDDPSAGYHPGQIWWTDLVVADHAEAAGTLVALGDSITAGHNAYGPPGQRWTDVLADRMDALPVPERLAVANAGISGNTVSVQPNPYDPTGQCCGAPAPERLDRDVLSVPGVRTVLLLEGTNDLGGGANAVPAPANQVISAIQSIVARVRARGLRIVGATILPMCNAVGSAKETARLAVNQWIRTSGVFDAVLDFDSILRDPGDPTQIVPELRTDCYHPNAAGDELLGQSIPLSVFG